MCDPKSMGFAPFWSEIGKGFQGQAQVVQRAETFIQRIGVHFNRWMAIYPVDSVIRFKNSRCKV